MVSKSVPFEKKSKMSNDFEIPLILKITSSGFFMSPHIMFVSITWFCTGAIG